MITTSYKQRGFADIIKGIVKLHGDVKIIELGTQQGHSAILLSKGGGLVDTYDLFEETYSQPPYKKTHANYKKALKNTQKHRIRVHRKDVNNVKPVYCDILHIDICNHYDNLYPLLYSWEKKVRKVILLEGGGLNKWQKKYKFRPFNLLLDDKCLLDWNHCVIKGKDGYALTILTRR